MASKKEIFDLISRGETRKAIAALLETTRSLDEDLYQEVAVQSAKFEQYKKDERAGTRDTEIQDVKLSRIHHALVEIVRRLPEGNDVGVGNSRGGDVVQKELPRKQYKATLIVISILSVIIIAGMLILNLLSKEKEVAADIYQLPVNTMANPSKSSNIAEREAIQSKNEAGRVEKQDVISSTKKELKPNLCQVKFELNSYKSKIYIDNVLRNEDIGRNIRHLEVTEGSHIVEIVNEQNTCKFSVMIAKNTNKINESAFCN